MGCRTGGLSDKWLVGQVGYRTSGLLDKYMSSCIWHMLSHMPYVESYLLYVESFPIKFFRKNACNSFLGKMGTCTKSGDNKGYKLFETNLSEKISLPSFALSLGQGSTNVFFLKFDENFNQ